MNRFIAVRASLRLKSERESIDLPKKVSALLQILVENKEETEMLLEIAYAELKLRELQRTEPAGRMERHVRANPNAEVARSGVGLVHEVFRRIAEGERPVRQPARRRRPVFG